MSIAPLLDAMQNLLIAHTNLILIADTKTKLLIEGNIEDLQKLIANERKFIRELERAENERQKASNQYAIDYNLTEENVTVTSLIERLENPVEKMKLEEVAVELVNRITELKRKEDMNHTLIQQSMQFVQFSLDVMNPNIEKMNYGHKNKDLNPPRSTFDSKA